MNQAINIFITNVNNVGESFWSHAAAMFIQSSLLILVLLAVDFLIQKKVRAVFRYGLWMLLFVKLVLPVSLASPTGVGYWLGGYFTSETSIANLSPQAESVGPIANNVSQGQIPFQTPIMSTAGATGIELTPISWQGFVFLGWLVGMGVLVALLVQRVYFVKGLIAQSKPASKRVLDILEECRSQVGLRRKIELRLSANSLSPAVCGLFRPVILMPAAVLEKLSQDKLKAVLIHELAHVRRGDLWVNLLQTMFQIAFFYNPLIWIANAMVCRAREQAVDEMVLVTLKSETNSYPNTLIDVAEMIFTKPNFSLSLIGVAESKKALERRIKHMLNRPTPTRSKLGALGLLSIITIGVILLPMGCAPGSRTVLTAPVEVGPKDFPFVNDPKAIGGWRAVDFVKDIEDFKPDRKSFKGDLFLKELFLLDGGKTNWAFTWTKGLILHQGDKTASKYLIKEIDGVKFMFFE